MIRKRILSMLTALGILIPTVAVTPTASAGTAEPLTKEVYANVAQNKPVKAGSYSETYPITNLVDGKRSTFIVGGGSLTDNESGKPSGDGKGWWFTVDLQHRYNIERIELWDRYNTADEGGRRWFKIFGANKADFSDSVELAVMGDENTGAFPDNGPFAVNLSGERAYRYVKMERTGGYYYGYSEFKVFAKQTVTDVARNKTATAGITDATYSTNAVLNGKNTASWDAWYGGYTGGNWLSVDLGSEQHIGYIELENMIGQADAGARKSKGLYGAKEFTDAIGETFAASANVTGVDGVKKLSHIGAAEDYIGWDDPFPMASATETNAYSVSVDDSVAYKNVVYHNETYPTGSCMALGAFRAYVINPTVTETSVADGKATVLFSDNMDAATVTADNLKVKDSSTLETVAVSNLQTDGYKVTFELPYNGDFDVTATANLKNTYGVSAAEKTVRLEAQDIYAGLPTYTRLYNVAMNKPVTVSSIENSGNQDKNPQNVVDTAWNTETIINYGGDDGAAATDGIITVDLLRRYKISKISLIPRWSAQNACWLSGFEIQASNDESFGTYKVLDTVTEANAMKATNQSAGTKYLSDYSGSGDEAFRYVRIFAKKHCLALAELMVWANQTMTEVSGNKDIIGSQYNETLYGPSSVNDGNLTNFWIGGYSGYPYFRIDLGQKYPIGAIELQARSGVGDSNSKRRFTVYGHNTDLLDYTDKAALAQKTASELYSDTDKYTSILNIVDIAATTDGYNPFPNYPQATDADPFMKANVNDTNAFRYITYKKTLSTTTQLGEFRALVVNPVVNSMEYKDGNVTVHFSDEMNAFSMTADKITVTDGDGNNISISNVAADGYDLSFSLEEEPAASPLTVNIGRKVRNTKGVTMASNYSGEIALREGIEVLGTSYNLDELAGGETLTASAKIKGSLMKEANNITLFLAVKKNGMLLGVDLANGVLSTGTSTLPLEASVTLPEDVAGVTAESYIWYTGTMIPLCDKTPFSSITRNITCWGDSLTDVTGGNSYTTTLAALSGREVNNMGIGSEDATAIAARQGGVRLYASEFTIPADTTPVSLNITTSAGTAYKPMKPLKGLESCTINGITGTLSWTTAKDENNNTVYSFSFTRETAGQKVGVASGTEIITAGADKYNDDVTIIWIGTNGGWVVENSDWNTYATYKKIVDGMISKLTTDKYLIVGLTNQIKTNMDTVMAEYYGDHYFNLRSYLSGASAEFYAEKGVALTDADTERMGSDLPPSSILLENDNTHFNKTGCEIVGEAIYNKLAEIGIL